MSKRRNRSTIVDTSFNSYVLQIIKSPNRVQSHVMMLNCGHLKHGKLLAENTSIFCIRCATRRK